MTEALKNNSSIENNSSIDNNNNSNTAAADTQTVLTPAQVLEQLRTLAASIPEIAPLTTKERRQMQKLGKVPVDVVLAQMDIIGVSDRVESAVGSTPEAAEELVAEDNRWTTVEGELQAILNGVRGANLIRRQKIQLLGAQSYGVGVLLARSEEHAELKPHVERVRRLKRLARGRKSAPHSPETPAPQTPPAGGSPTVM
jgi:hypothetical protein